MAELPALPTLPYHRQFELSASTLFRRSADGGPAIPRRRDHGATGHKIPQHPMLSLGKPSTDCIYTAPEQSRRFNALACAQNA